MALAEPTTETERELADKLNETQREKLSMVTVQTDLLRRAADLAEKLEEHEDESRALIEARQKAEVC